MKILEVSIHTQQESAEAVSAMLMELGAGGTVLEEAFDWERAKREGLGDYFPEEKGLQAKETIVRGYFPVSFLGSAAEKKLREFVARLPFYGFPGGTVSIREVDDKDWVSSWKEYWQPTPVGVKLVIVPAWYGKYREQGRRSLYLDPGAAFGTGTHETTRLCLEKLEEIRLQGKSVTDLGCGSGILALAAKLLGAGRTVGVDHDELAVRSSRENAARNGLEATFFRGNLLEEECWRKLPQSDIITANLTADLIIAISHRLESKLLPGGQIIASGIIASRKEETAARLQKCGLVLEEEKSDGQWTALILGRK